jgi:hypothetical protein
LSLRSNPGLKLANASGVNIGFVEDLSWSSSDTFLLTALRRKSMFRVAQPSLACDSHRVDIVNETLLSKIDGPMK